MGRYTGHDKDKELAAQAPPDARRWGYYTLAEIEDAGKERRDILRARRRVWLAEIMSDIDRMGGNNWTSELYAASVTALALYDTIPE